jgi:hypothetical protein
MTKGNDALTIEAFYLHKRVHAIQLLSRRYYHSLAGFFHLGARFYLIM